MRLERAIESMLEHLNEAPYVYVYIGTGVNLNYEKAGIKFTVTRNKVLGGLDILFQNIVFHFLWDFKKEKWSYS